MKTQLQRLHKSTWVMLFIPLLLLLPAAWQWWRTHEGLTQIKVAENSHVFHVVFSSNGQRLLVLAEDETTPSGSARQTIISMWDIPSHQELWQKKWEAGLT